MVQTRDLVCWWEGLGLVINPLLPTGQFMAPKLIILIKCLIDVLFFSVVLTFLYVEQDVNLA